ncbi:aminotransferase class III-fold pyridoxal phosphate-dependent enzyme [Pseudomonas aeruginosa]|uniref:aminotransferase class III-fold pyridoxal phosphate-dependent enzyme n=1 Tax=Pseudomonas aeruginosa TaxID=287 RepID=UPI00249AD27F|nr:aminotransferase class III-fold pyridoxal phosphate-dependent enzyme [Pseudomonas aeruginosa]WGX01845.1 aminotransferase class III-fold pyridoxal phosphate-dependent enzyme [Pseudomonas aeruginosa]
MMPIAKGLTSGYIPMGGVVVRDEIVEVLNQGGEFYHGFTYSGHPVAAAVAENIRILREEKIIEKVKAETAPYLQKRWQELADHPLVGEARGVGMVAALELVKNKKTRERFTDKGVGMLYREHCFRNGLIMRAVGDTMIISPPLVIDPSQIDELEALARKCLDQTAAAVLAESLSGLLPNCASALARLTGW